jgi:uncharacterized membrane protein YgdD (TMEM256/DUF423 family)
MDRKIIMIGSAAAGLVVAIGAFGAHAFNDILATNSRISTFETGVQYHLFHALSILICGILPITRRKMIAYFFMIGIVLFSGSLYLLSLTSATYFGAIAPIGGTAFIIGWVILSIESYRYH